MSPMPPTMMLQGIRRSSHHAMTFHHARGSGGAEISPLKAFAIIFLSHGPTVY